MTKNNEAIQVKLHRFDSCIANRKGKTPVFDGRLSEEAAEFLFLLLAENAQKNAYYQQDHTDHNEDGAGIGGAAADQAVELSLQAVVLHKAKTGADNTSHRQNDTKNKHADSPFSLFSLLSRISFLFFFFFLFFLYIYFVFH